MSNPAWVKAAQNFWHSIIHDSQKVIIDELTPLVAFLEAKGGTAILESATAYLAGASISAPWSILVAQFLPMAEAAGVKLLEDEAGIVLNIAKAKLALPASA